MSPLPLAQRRYGYRRRIPRRAARNRERAKGLRTGRVHLRLAGNVRSDDERDNPVEYAYKRTGSAGFSQTIEAVEHAVGAHGFVVHASYDIGGTVGAKGFAIRPLVILEVGPDDDDLEQPLSLVLPCRINIYEEGGEVVVAALRPTVFVSVYPEHDLEAVAAEVEHTIVGIVNSAVG